MEIVEVFDEIIFLPLLWFHYSQNNSGGYFEVNDDVCEDVLIHANSMKDAMERADKLFEGVSGFCPCCGERWYSEPEEGTKHPTIYGVPVWLCEPTWTRKEIRLHFLDGTVVKSIRGEIPPLHLVNDLDKE